MYNFNFGNILQAPPILQQVSHSSEVLELSSLDWADLVGGVDSRRRHRLRGRGQVTRSRGSGGSSSRNSCSVMWVYLSGVGRCQAWWVQHWHWVHVGWERVGGILQLSWGLVGWWGSHCRGECTVERKLQFIKVVHITSTSQTIQRLTSRCLKVLSYRLSCVQHKY